MPETLTHPTPVLESSPRADVSGRQTAVIADGITIENPTLAEYYHDVHTEIQLNRDRPAEVVAAEWLGPHTLYDEVATDVPPPFY
jgi:hypothetical protein